MRKRWVPAALRDEVVDFVIAFSHRIERPVRWVLRQLDVAPGQLHRMMPRTHWTTAAERQALLEYHAQHPLDGYRRLSYMMRDADVVAVSPATVYGVPCTVYGVPCTVYGVPCTVYRVLRLAGVLDRWNRKTSLKGTGFVQPRHPHEHWPIDITSINIAGTFYSLCAILDGASRYLVHGELREVMITADVEMVLQRAHEQHPDARPRIISDNGPQCIAKDFKELIRLAGMTLVRTSPYSPPSNGKLEAWHKTLNVTAIRPASPDSLEEARQIVARFVDHHRLHSAIGYITPADRLAGRAEEIKAARDRKLEAQRQRRAVQQSTLTPCQSAVAALH